MRYVERKDYLEFNVEDLRLAMVQYANEQRRGTGKPPLIFGAVDFSVGSTHAVIGGVLTIESVDNS